MSAIVIDGVTKHYGPYRALSDVSLAVGHGERVVICGPSGSGKSTLIRCVNGLEPFQAGRILVDGVEVGPGHARLLPVRRKAGMVFQQFNLFPHMTVLRNCTIAPMRAQGVGRPEAEARAMSALERMRIADQARKYPSQLSGGQQQRVAIARSLCMSPAMMLFDEPTSSLDPEMVKEVLDAIMALADSGMTIVCVTHEMGLAKHMANRVVFMDGGCILEIAEPSDFFRSPAHPRAREFLANVTGHGAGP